ncbi:MAG: SdiA-regulated domain-containing protein [Melioribacteraceae bacterium]|nr:SdiA-regulated domain-containing protein [Melioribacteraceae bacterium]
MYKILMFAVLIISCGGEDKMFSGYNIFSENIKSIKLDKKLKEISGLTFTKDSRLFCHNDEKGEIFEIDFDGNIIKSFYLKGKLKEDFEDIAFFKDHFYLVTSSGTIYQFNEANDGEEIEYQIYDTGLKSKYDVEGLCVDHESKSLLLACKEFPGKGLKGNRAIYSFSLEKNILDETPRYIISIDKIKDYGFNNFHPSAIGFNNKTKSYFLVDGKNSLIMEIDTLGNIMNISSLNKKNHKQPEGLTFYKDGTMIISDEGNSGKARITFYQYSTN